MKRHLTAIDYLDFISALAVLVALLGINKNPYFWLLYAGACLSFVGINYYKKLYGQGTMNLIAVIIAIKNFINNL